MTPAGSPRGDIRRPDMRARLQRDLQRYGRRDPTGRKFWQSLGVLGSVGWPVVVSTVGGAWLGRWLDARFQTGMRFTLILLVAGAVAGAALAWRFIQPRR
jgi:ATP synthase protein I